MSRDEAKRWLDTRYVLHPSYRAADHPHHSSYAEVDVRVTFMRVRGRMRQERESAVVLSHFDGAKGPTSFTGAVEQTRQRLRLVHGRVA